MRAVDVALAGAMLAQITLTLAVGVRLGFARARAVREGTVQGNAMLSNDAWPPYARQASNCFSNQFEVPVLFYALVLLALTLTFAGPVYAGLAWVFVVSRAVHALVHVTSNDLRLRAPSYFVGVLIVLIMTVMAAVALFAG
jgi:hypothetical protein